MSYKSIFSVATPTDEDDAVDTAIACARKWSAHLDVTCTTADAIDVPTFVAPDMVVAAPTLRDDDAKALEEVQKRLEQRLTGETFGWSVDAFATYGADVARRLAQTNRFADLAVLAASGAEPSGLMHGVLEALLYTSRVPVLLAPDGIESDFDRVMLAWDGSDAALAATRAALPILAQAASVEIVIVEPESDTMGHDLAIMLNRHGTPAPVMGLTRNGKRIAEALTDHARDTEADLIVMGAYGHRRLREIFIGGVTRNMLGAAPVPLFLAR
ncbi:Universal stress protein family protein [Rhodobacteraceae bacterium THAF1]|uniref:universal stress protein n=1 Tax=Palleronia sp. THAF1 TaxID=2587842 RepID=UPI000F3ED08D|nr:universal stress protein [Palleronia sp. THAF1]QFU08800.1 Universal stress protein family protein [Palleronia sp. THAF1]VDC23935.1 Universal stress protein family protein [Rhodobacteraceae bacterium THAF1]